MADKNNKKKTLLALDLASCPLVQKKAKKKPSELEIRKRRRDRNDSICGQPESKKMDIGTKLNALNLTDLNIDCLESIFNHLDLIDLFNVSELNENTFEAARLVFSRQFTKYQCIISGHESPHPICVNDATITINCDLAGLRFMRTFGGLMKKLQLDYIRNEQLMNDSSEVQSVFNKCATALTELRLINCDETIFSYFENTFENVTNLRISCSRLGKCMDLNKWFPKLTNLEFLHNDGCVQIAFSFPYLSFLVMDSDIERPCATTSDFETIIKSAPGLKSLSLSGAVNANLLQFVSDHLPELTKLRLVDFHLLQEDDEVITFPTVETLHVSTGLLGMLPSEIPFQFEHLKELHVISDSVGDKWLEFALSNSDLERLHLDSIWEPEIDDIHLAQFAKQLPKLQEVDVIAHVSPDGLEHLLKECKTLKKIRVKNYGTSNFNEFHQMGKSNGGWEITKEKRGVIFERKNK